MVDSRAARLDDVFGAVADPTRRAILDTLARGEVTVGELAARFPISLNGVSKHIRVLERAGLITRDVRGREHRLTFDARPLEDAAAWMERYRAFWESRLDALEGLIRSRKRTRTNEMTAGGQDALVVRRVIRASRDEIFDMWTAAVNLRLWMRPRARAAQRRIRPPRRRPLPVSVLAIATTTTTASPFERVEPRLPERAIALPSMRRRLRAGARRRSGRCSRPRTSRR